MGNILCSDLNFEALNLFLPTPEHDGKMWAVDICGYFLFVLVY